LQLSEIVQGEHAAMVQYYESVLIAIRGQLMIAELAFST
jgi:hypothetical protein